MKWFVVGLLCMGMMVAYLDRVNLSVALAEKPSGGSMREQFNLTDQDRGVLNSAFFWTYAALQIPAGFAVDRFGAKGPYALGFLLWSLLSAGTAFAGSVRQLIVIRGLLGVFESVVTPAGMRWIRYNCAENQRGLAVGLFMAAAKIGPAVGTPVAAWLIVAYGWRSMFVILGLGCMVWLAPWMKYVKNDDREIEIAQSRQSPAMAVRFSAVLASPVLWGTVIGTFCYMFFVYFCMTWMPAYFVDRRGMSLNGSGIYTGFSFLGMAVVATLAGWAADRLIDRGYNAVRVRKAFVIAGFLVASTELIGALADSMPVALFFAIFSLSGLGLTTANYWALTQTLIPGPAVGRIVGIQNCAASLPGIVAPLLTGWLVHKTGTYDAPMQAIWFFMLTGIAAYVFLVRPEYAPRRAAASV
jgi:MFS family permease